MNQEYPVVPASEEVLKKQKETNKQKKRGKLKRNKSQPGRTYYQTNLEQCGQPNK